MNSVLPTRSGSHLSFLQEQAGVREFGMDMYTLFKMDDTVLLYSTGNSAQSYVASWMGGESGENGYMHTYGWVPLLFTETITTLLINCKYKCYSLSRVWLFVSLWTIACQAPLSMGFSRQEYWSGLPFPSPGDLPTPWIEPRSPA